MLTFRPDLDLHVPGPGQWCAAGESSAFVLPFFFSGRAGHLELPRCRLRGVHSRRGGDGSAIRLRLLAGRLDSVTVSVLERRHSRGEGGEQPRLRAGGVPLSLAAGETAPLQWP